LQAGQPEKREYVRDQFQIQLVLDVDQPALEAVPCSNGRKLVGAVFGSRR
jgi:hypothetical protein